jgi:hypothetical protein
LQSPKIQIHLAGYAKDFLMINGVDPGSFRIDNVESPMKRFTRRLTMVIAIVILVPLCLIFITLVHAIFSGGVGGTEPVAANTEQIAPPVQEAPVASGEPIKEQPSPEPEPAQQPAGQAPAPVSTPVPTPVVAAPDISVTYGSCKDVRAAGKAPIHRGDPGYTKNLDRDEDGIGCEG